MGKRKEYRKIIKNYKEQKIVFQEEMKLDYSKLLKLRTLKCAYAP